MSEDLDEVFEKDVLAIDGDSLGAFGRSGFRIEQITTAVNDLQSEGLKVILVRNQAVAEHLCAASSTFDASNLLHVPSLGDTGVDTVKVAADYQCFFLTNRDVVELENDWRLPRHCKQWVHKCRSFLQIRFTFDGAGTFKPEWPEHAPHHKRRQNSWNVQLSPSLAQASSPCGMSPPKPMVQQPSQVMPIVSSPEPTVHEPSQLQLSLLPPEPTFQQPSQLMLSEYPLQSTTASGCEVRRPEGKGPPVMVLKPPSCNGVPPMVCIRCEDPRAWLFPHAAELATSTTRAEVAEDEKDAYLLSEIRQAHAGEWYTAAIAMSGRHKGLRGIGLGSKHKSRKRAARLALAAHARVIDGGPVENPSGDGAFMVLVNTARALLGTDSKVIGGMNSVSQDELSPPPPPPGVIPQTAPQLPPPPPPPPTGNLFLGRPTPAQHAAMEPWVAAASSLEFARGREPDPAARFAPSAESMPVELFRTAEKLLDRVKRQGASTMRSANSPPVFDSTPYCSIPGPFSKYPSYNSLPCGPAPRQRTRARTKRAMATAKYDAEGDGYLSLSYGDTVELLHDTIEPGTFTDLYPRYAYGQLLDEQALYRAHIAGHTTVGWFPYDLSRSIP